MWQPVAEHAGAVAGMLAQVIGSVDNDRQREIAQQFEEWSQAPELCGYLTHILATDAYPPQVRVAAGYSLKSALEKLQAPVSEELQVYLRRGLEHSLTDPLVQGAASTLASTMYVKFPWNTLVLDIVFRLLHDAATQGIGLATLYKIIEDIREDSELWKQLESPEHSQILSALIPKVIECASTQRFKVINQLLFIMPSALIPWVARYTEEVLRSAVVHDPNICEAILTLSTLRKDLMKPHFQQCAEYMLQSQMTDHSRTACEFWSEWLEKSELVEPLLPRLLPTLLDLLIITDQDLMSLMPDAEADFRYDKGEGEGHWTIRRESACLLDKLSDVFGDQCFVTLQNRIQEKLLSQQWQHQESGLLALGALAFGSGAAIRPHLGQLLPFFWEKMQSPERLVRAMAMWTASRFTDDVLAMGATQQYLANLMRGVGDADSVVRTAACTAFCVLVTRESSDLMQYLEEVMALLATALPLYRGRALLSLLDAISSLAEAQPTSFAASQSTLMESLITLWRRTDNADRVVWAIYEAFAAAAIALGEGFGKYAIELMDRCAFHISQALAEVLEKQFGVKALELVGACAESCSGAIRPCIERLHLLHLMGQCLGDSERALRQYACATLGDLVVMMTDLVLPYIPNLLPRLLNCLELLPEGSDVHDTYLSTTNNAICTLGEIAIHSPSALAEAVPQLLERVLDLWRQPVRLPQFRANVMASIGKMGVANPAAVANCFGDYFPAWARAMATVPASHEKGDSFTGALIALAHRPDVAFKHFGSVVEAVTSYPEATPAVKSASLALFSSMQQRDPMQWQSALSSLSTPLHASLQASLSTPS